MDLGSCLLNHSTFFLQTSHMTISIRMTYDSEDNCTLPRALMLIMMSQLSKLIKSFKISQERNMIFHQTIRFLHWVPHTKFSDVIIFFAGVTFTDKRKRPRANTSIFLLPLSHSFDACSCSVKLNFLSILPERFPGFEFAKGKR